MEFTKEQLSEVISKHTRRENGLQDLMEIMLESMMMSERLQTCYKNAGSDAERRIGTSVDGKNSDG